MHNFFEQLKKNIQTLEEVNTKSVFTIATTSKKENGVDVQKDLFENAP